MKSDSGASRPAVIAVTAIGIAVALVGSGWAIAHGHVAYPMAVMSVTVLATLLVVDRGTSIALLTLAACNGLPFVNDATLVFRGIRIQDAAIAILVVAALVWATLDSTEHKLDVMHRRLSWTGMALLAWWLFTLARTVVGGASISLASGYARDFLYFALLLTLLPRVSLSRRDIVALVTVLGIGACLFAAGQIVVSLGLSPVTWEVHTTFTVQQAGLTRAFTQTTDLVVVALAASLAAMLAAPGRHGRLLAPAISLLLAVSIVVQLGRARWIGLLVGLIAVIGWIVLRERGRTRGRLGRRLSAGGFGLAVAVVLVAVAGADSVLSSGIATRALSTISTLASGSGSVGYRQGVISTMTGILGGNWPIGLGFIPPSVHYYLGLPGGALRDSDVGVMGAVMTMGAVGAALIFWPVLRTLAACLRRQHGQREREREFEWLRYGGMIWITAALVTCLTLDTLFSTSGLVVSSIALIIIAHPCVTAPEPISEPAGAPVPARRLHQLRPASPA